MVKNKLLYATIAAMLMGAVFTGCSNTHNNNTTTESQSIVSLEELASSADSDLSIELDDEDKVSSWDDSSVSPGRRQRPGRWPGQGTVWAGRRRSRWRIISCCLCRWTRPGRRWPSCCGPHGPARWRWAGCSRRRQRPSLPRRGWSWWATLVLLGF